MPKIVKGTPFQRFFVKYTEILAAIIDLPINSILDIIKPLKVSVPADVLVLCQCLDLVFSDGASSSYDHFRFLIMGPSVTLSSDPMFNSVGLLRLSTTFCNLFLTLDVGDLNVALLPHLQTLHRRLSTLQCSSKTCILLQRYLHLVINLMVVQKHNRHFQTFDPNTDIVCSITFKQLTTSSHESTPAKSFLTSDCFSNVVDSFSI
ncbi:hypothetical protein GEMRC1_004057 [Eukaryota sp. GEM-RC1]